MRQYLARAMSPGLREAVASKLRLDSWVNVITGLGGRKDRSTLGEVGSVKLLSVPELDALYHGDDLPAKIVDKLPTEAFRLGFKTGSQDVDDACLKWGAADKLLEARIWGRLYGGGAIYMGFSDRLGKQDQPVDLTKVQRSDLRFLQVLDRWELSVAEWEDCKTSEFYGDVKSFRVTPLTGASSGYLGTPIHRSRLILFGGARTSARWRRLNQGFDLSILQRCQDVLRDVDQSWRSVMSLMADLSQAVFKINGLVSMLAEGQKDVVMERMEIVDLARSVARAVVVDKDGEDFEHVGAQNITGVDPLLVRVFQRLAAAADMPLTVLFGVSPAGLNATGESDLRIWYAAVESERRAISPLVRRLVRVIARSEGLTPPEEISWPSLWEPTEAEKADLETKQATADQIRITSQVLSPEQVQAVRYGGKRWEDVMVQPTETGVGVDSIEDEYSVSDVPADYKIEIGSVWTDTRDMHRIRVNAEIGPFVYLVDLDVSPEQFRWSRGAFLERCTPPVASAPNP